MLISEAIQLVALDFGLRNTATSAFTKSRSRAMRPRVKKWAALEQASTIRALFSHDGNT
jgi:hypothetical protein